MTGPAQGWIGRPLPRLEDRRFLAGQARYAADVRLPGLLQVAFVRSPHAHARVLDVDVARAVSAPGVVGVYRGGERVPGPLPVLAPHPDLAHPATGHPLVRDVARYVGEPVAAVVAADRQRAEDAADLVGVEYERLAPVASLDAALAPGGVRVHAHLEDNVAGRCRTAVGDVDAALRAAGAVVHRRLLCERGGHLPMETRGVTANWAGAEGVLTVWMGTQSPHRHQAHLARLLGIEPDRLRVIATEMGGGFGQKGNIYPEDVLVPWLAMQLGRPVQWVEDRRENFLAATQDRLQVHDVTLAADREGRLLALRDHFLYDLGAYCPYGLMVADIGASGLVGPYRIPNLDVQFTAVFTNRPPSGVYRGPGRVQAAFALERSMDALARELGLAPDELRRRNLIQPADLPHDTGMRSFGRTQVYDSGDYPAALDLALETADYRGWRRRQVEARRRGRRIGIGLADYVEATGSGPYEGCTLRVDPEGAVWLFTGAVPHGQGQPTTLAQVAAQELGVHPERVRVVTGDTAIIRYGVGTFASRTMVNAGNAVAMAAREVRRLALELAARRLEADPSDLELVEGEACVRGAPSRRVSLGALAAAAAFTPMPDGAPPALEATRYFYPPSPTFGMGVHVAVVEVDAATGVVRLLRYVVVDDCGVQVNPLVVRGQILGGVAQGIGAALYERLVYDDDAQPLSASFMDYLLPTSAEVPEVQVAHSGGPSPLNPLGLKGAGEAGVIPVAACLAGAVEDALGCEVSSSPLSPEAVWRLGAGASGAEGGRRAAGGGSG